MMTDPDYDAYLSLLCRFLRLSPSQRDEVRRELRSHMEEAIEAQMACGVSREEAIRRALEDFGDAAELAARFSNIGRRRRWIMKGTAAAACIGFAALAINTLPLRFGAQSARPGNDANARAATMTQQHDSSDNSDRDRRIEEALSKRIPEISLEAVPLREVTQWFSEVTGIANVYVDWPRLEDNGIDRETPISIELTDVTAERFLRLLLNEVNPDIEMQYGVLDGILIISTPDRFQKDYYVEVYDVSDLRTARDRTHGVPRARDAQRKIDSENVAGEKPATSELVELIQNAVAPDSWQANGGIGFIRIYNDMLVVRQPEPVHAELTRMLSVLRETKSD